MKIQQIPLGVLSTNCYLLTDGDEAVLIDAAAYSARLSDYIKMHNLTLKYILLTHGHPDHVMGAMGFKRAHNAIICMSEKDMPWIERLKNQGAMEFGMPASEFQDLEIDRFVKEGDEICFGNTVMHILDIPGHTPGGLCYYTEYSAFSGDSLFQSSIGRTDMQGGNMDTLINSIKKKLYSLSDETEVFPGHGPSTSIGYEKKHNQFVKA